MLSLLSEIPFVSGCEPLLPSIHIKKAKEIRYAKPLRENKNIPFKEILLDMLHHKDD